MRQKPELQTFLVSIEHNQLKSQGQVSYISWTKEERTQRAVRWFFLFLGFALVAILIPGLHFILVPAFCLSSPAVAYYVFKQDHVVKGGKGICPECKKEFLIANSFKSFPFQDVCDHCYCALKIDRIP